MDGSNAPVSAESLSTQKNKGKIIGGIVGGTFGLMLVLLVVFCIYVPARRRSKCRRHSRKKVRERSVDDAPLKAEPPSKGTEVPPPAVQKPTVPLPRKHTKIPPDVVAMKLSCRPLPEAPRAAPALPATTPYVSTSIHHETPFINVYGPQKAPILATGTPKAQSEMANPFEG